MRYDNDIYVMCRCDAVRYHFPVDVRRWRCAAIIHVAMCADVRCVAMCDDFLLYAMSKIIPKAMQSGFLICQLCRCCWFDLIPNSWGLAPITVCHDL